MPGIIDHIIPPHCFKKLVYDHDFNVACIKIVLSKLLGYSIILGSVLVKVPQIYKIVKAKSAEGISLLGVIFELIASTGTLAYGFANGFPFSAYGESTFMTLQQIVILFLVVNFGFGTGAAILSTSIYSAIVALLLSPSVPMKLLTILQGSVVVLVVISRLSQTTTNFVNKSTGQLSLITTLLQFVGAFIRILTSLQETGDHMTILMYVTSTITNGILLLQVFQYWNSGTSVSSHAEASRSSLARCPRKMD